MIRRSGPVSAESVVTWNSAMASTAPSCALNTTCSVVHDNDPWLQV